MQAARQTIIKTKEISKRRVRKEKDNEGPYDIVDLDADVKVVNEKQAEDDA